MNNPNKTVVCSLIFFGAGLGLAACQPQKQTQPQHNPANGGLTDLMGPATSYLLSAQGDDGKWHSTQYGNLKDGAAITALVMYALSFSQNQFEAEAKQRCQRALDVMLPIIEDRYYVSNPDGADYSNYGSAMLLVAAERLQLELPSSARDKLIQYLVRAQLDEGEGFEPGDVDYGGWDLTGWMTGQRPTTGTNISVTTSVLQALAQYDERADVAAALKKCRPWLSRCQNVVGDGGFFFHPRRDHDGNKAGWITQSRDQPRSYGTATADGLRSLQYLNFDDASPQVQAATKWLSENNALNRVPGFEHETGTGSWAKGLRFYYYYSLSMALGQLEPKHARRTAAQIMKILLGEQKADGSWQNDNARMREDDPLIATCFALIAAARCRALDR